MGWFYICHDWIIRVSLVHDQFLFTMFTGRLEVQSQSTTKDLGWVTDFCARRTTPRIVEVFLIFFFIEKTIPLWCHPSHREPSLFSAMHSTYFSAQVFMSTFENSDFRAVIDSASSSFNMVHYCGFE